MNTHCYICNNEISTKNQSIEHVILNAIGGRIKSKNLICANCNSYFGDDIDAELARQLNNFANLLRIRREKGIPQPVRGKHSKTGEEYNISINGIPAPAKPKFEISSIGGNPHVNINARDLKEFRKIITGLKKKYPQIDVEDIVKRATVNKEPLDAPLKIDQKFGGEKAFRSILKTAINFFLINGGERHFIHHLIPVLKGEKPCKDVWYFYTSEIPALNNFEIFHRLYLVGNPDEKFLYCYIDFFGGISFIALLNIEYNGVPISINYKYNLSTYTEDKNENFQIDLDKDYLLSYVAQEPDVRIHVQNHIQRLLNIAKHIEHQEKINSIIREAAVDSIAKIIEGKQLDKQTLDKFFNKVSLDVAAYLYQQGHLSDDKFDETSI